ncbi:macro domain-containing protein [Pelobacter propionicus]|uniref:Appr-1-p processing domain protein n=1 Tax=Pelobacter propionicus (strain DSM 2379 / NBRC 103807 / OttBd1) TaxID=338966 RepID=A1AMX4_PELPD|nr:macro domain-containing protein [Pelobacter propionicus]ABK98694.1 Appr-1-p processing domain protein [Pelobacter propionicus DSM 2379]
MKEIRGDIWEYRDSAIVAITTNGQVSRSGKAVMGRGVAAQAASLFPDMAQLLGRRLVEGGNHVQYLGENIVSFPVEHSPYQVPDLRLIERSARELVALADEQGWRSVVVPRPGCGGGGLSWNEVRPILDRCFDDRFTVISVDSTDAI